MDDEKNLVIWITQTPTKPSNRWRNQWRKVGTSMEFDIVSRTFRGPIHDGSVFWGQTEHPSKEIAETIALEAIRGDIAKGRPPNEWLGAVPFASEPNP